MHVLLLILLTLGGISFGWLFKWLKAKIQLVAAERVAARKVQEVDLETERLREQLKIDERKQLDSDKELMVDEIRQSRNELKQMETQLNHRFALLREREDALKRLKSLVTERQRKISEFESHSTSLRQELRERLEKVSGSTIQEIKDQLIENHIIEGKRDAQFVIARAEEETQRTAELKANEIVVSSTQSLPLSQIIEHSLTSLETPTQQIIEHLLSREGRFIRILESLLKVELSVEDSEDGLVLSSPDPINREIARATLDRLYREGRLNPHKISETVRKVRREISVTMHQEAVAVLRDLGMKNVREETIEALGRLLYRYSYGQNNLYHSKEVAILAAKLAQELGCDPEIAKRGGLLHDIGKGFALDGKAHVEMGMELVQKWSEDPRVLNAIASHHDDTEQLYMEAVIVQIADAISGSRPGARRETISNYLERVENLERIAEEFEGVDKAFAIYAGRELRVLANSEEVDDETAGSLASGIARKIEESLKYPGKIKVTVIREMKISNFTR